MEYVSCISKLITMHVACIYLVQVVTGRMSRVGSVRQRPSSTAASIRGAAASPEGVKALESVLLIGSSPSKRSPADGSNTIGGGGNASGDDGGDDVDPEIESKFAAGAESLQKNQRMTSRGSSRAHGGKNGVNIKGCAW